MCNHFTADLHVLKKMTVERKQTNVLQKITEMRYRFYATSYKMVVLKKKNYGAPCTPNNW